MMTIINNCAFANAGLRRDRQTDSQRGGTRGKPLTHSITDPQDAFIGTDCCNGQLPHSNSIAVAGIIVEWESDYETFLLHWKLLILA